ncbi:MAG: hypothetical protein LUD00_11635 [Prevotellaceae bacterium]|nr:hypothetical protein [Prevotellaceae bacterium]
MYIRKKKYPSGNIGIIVVEKIHGKMKELHTVGIAHNEEEAEGLVAQGREWIDREEARRLPHYGLCRRCGAHDNSLYTSPQQQCLLFPNGSFYA